MAFGDQLGTVSFGATSISGGAAAATGSFAVSVGDLLVCVVSERSSLTVTGVTDSLGHTYTAQNAGTDGGNQTGRAFWKIATSGGTLTSMTAALTTSADDIVVVGAGYTGPFAASPLDATPGNATIVSTNTASCPASGTLAQADELVVGWVGMANGETISTQAPFTQSVSKLSSSGGASNSCGGAICRKVVAATTSVIPVFTFGAGQASITGLMSFKKGSSSPVLDASATSFAFTGSVATLKRGYRLDASATSFAFTGTNATLQKNLPLHASATSFAFSGTDATLKRNRRLDASATSFAFTGSNVTLQKNLPIVAGSGAFTFTGTDATLKIGHKLAASATSFAFTGTDATLKVGHRLDASATSFAFTGTDATLKRGYKILASATSFAFTGTDATLKVGHKIPASATSFAFTGSDATLTKSASGALSIIVDSGAFSFTGTDATLKVGHKIQASATSFAFTGTDASLERGYRLIADAAGGTQQARVTLVASDTLGANVNNVAIGVRDTAGDTLATPVELLFSGLSGFSIAAGQSITSDWADIELTSATGVVYSQTLDADNNGWGGYSGRNICPLTGGSTAIVIIDNGATSGLRGFEPLVFDTNSYYKAAPTYSEANPAGLSIYDWKHVSSIETRGGGGVSSFAFTGGDVTLTITSDKTLQVDTGAFLYTGTDADFTITGTATPAAGTALYGHWRGPKRRPMRGRTRLLSELDPKEDELLFTPEEILDLDEPELAPEVYAEIIDRALEQYETRARTLAIAAEEAAQLKAIADADSARAMAREAARLQLRRRRQQDELLMMMD